MTQKTKYEKFLDEFKKEKYTSKMAEYKRTSKKTVKMNIKGTSSDIFKEILKQVLKGNKDDDKGLMEGDQIQIKDMKAFVYKFEIDKEFAYIYRGAKTKDFFISTFKIEETTRDYCIVEFSYETKTNRTITGFNGMLGNYKFKKRAKELGMATLNKLKRLVEKNNS